MATTRKAVIGGGIAIVLGGLLPQLHSIGCGFRDDGKSPDVAAAEADLARLEAERVAGLPTDPPTLALLRRAEPYYRESGFLWATCIESSYRLNRKGYPTAPGELLAGMSEVMERLGVRPVGDQRVMAFISSYESRRADPPGHDDGRRPASHRDAIEALVRDEKFANEDPPPRR